METPAFDFRTDPAPIEAGHGDAGIAEPASSPAEGESTSRSHGVNVTPSAMMAASAGSVVEQFVGVPCTQAEESSATLWEEVPAERFLSWSNAEQRAYCAARDLASAAEAETLAESEWFSARARSYMEAA